MHRLHLPLWRHGLHRFGGDTFGQEGDHLGGMEVGQRLEKLDDLARWQPRDALVVVARVQGLLGRAAQELDVLPRDAVVGAPGEVAWWASTARFSSVRRLR